MPATRLHREESIAVSGGPSRSSDSDATDDSSALHGCPRCDGSIYGAVTLGPGEHFAKPCGCRLSRLEVEAMLD